MEFKNDKLWLYYLPFDLKKYIAALSKDYFFKKRCWSIEYVIYIVKNDDISFIFKNNFDFWKSLWIDNISIIVPNIEFIELRMCYIYIMTQKIDNIDELNIKYQNIKYNNTTKLIIKKEQQLNSIIKHISHMKNFIHINNKNCKIDKIDGCKIDDCKIDDCKIDKIDECKIDECKIKMYYYEKYVNNNVNAKNVCDMIENNVGDYGNYDKEFIKKIENIVLKGINFHCYNYDISKMVTRAMVYKENLCCILFSHGMYLNDIIKIDRHFSSRLLNLSIHNDIFFFSNYNNKSLLFNNLIKTCHDPFLIKNFMLKYNIDINIEPIIEIPGTSKLYRHSHLYTIASWYTTNAMHIYNDNYENKQYYNDKNNIEKIIELFLNIKADPNYSVNEGRTIITEIIYSYLSCRYKINAKNIKHGGPSSWDIDYEKNERKIFDIHITYLVQKFIEYGYDINKKDDNNYTVLSYAIKYKDEEMIKLLLKYGSKQESTFYYIKSYLSNLFCS